MFKNTVKTVAKVAVSGVRHYGNRREDDFDPLLDLMALTFTGVFAAHIVGIGASKAIDFVGKISAKDYCPFAKPPIDGDGGDS